MARSRGWCFTLNNPTQDDENECFELGLGRRGVYICVGRETAASGTPHLQGFVYFPTLTSFPQVNACFDGRAHWERQRGTPVQAADYCKKDGDFFESGPAPSERERGGSVERLRWETALRAAEDGRFEDIPADIRIRYDNALYRIRARFLQNVKTVEGPLQHEWWYGEPGTGKTSRAHREYPDAYLKDPETQWWDGYNGEEVVIIDDVDKYHKAMGGKMKRWLDRYPFRAQTKGGYVLIRPRKIIVTSNYHYEQIWDDEVTVMAIDRRVTVTRFDTI